MRKLLLTAVGLAVCVTAHASITIATFADPTTTGDSFLFTWNHTNKTLEGLWTASGLNLNAPGFAPPTVYNNAHFAMKPVNLTEIIPNVLYTMGSGQINFYTTDPNSPIFTIDFSGGSFMNPFTVGSSELQGNAITFSGPNVPAPLANEQFSFSFANAKTVGDITTFTASFTSSADVVPEPATLLALGAGLAAVVARRRRQA